MKTARLSTLALAACLAVGAAAIAQYALDNNLQRGAGGLNPGRSRQVVTNDSYTLNRDTGTFEFNDANAFAMPQYGLSRMPSSYTQYHRDTVRPMSARDGVYTLDRKSGTYRYNSTNAFSQPGYTPRTIDPPPPTRIYSPQRAPSVPVSTGRGNVSSRAPSLAAPSYRLP